MSEVQDKPLASILIPLYNAEKYFDEYIKYMICQTYISIEVIIVYDSSTNKTEEIILSYDDQRVVYMKNETNLQIVKTFNKGIALAKGKYIARMDADDISLPERFEKQIEFMEKHPKVDICGTWIKTIGHKDEERELPRSHEEIKASLLFGTALAHPTILAKRSLFETFPYQEKYNKAEDYALWTTAIDHYTFSNIQSVLLLYRLHSDQTEQTERATQASVTSGIRSRVLKKFEYDFPARVVDSLNRMSEEQYISVAEAEELLQYLLIANRKSNIYDEDVLRSIFSQRIWWVFNNNTRKGMELFFGFRKSSFRHALALTLYAEFKFFIKCLIGYTHES